MDCRMASGHTRDFFWASMESINDVMERSGDDNEDLGLANEDGDVVDLFNSSLSQLPFRSGGGGGSSGFRLDISLGGGVQLSNCLSPELSSETAIFDADSFSSRTQT